MVKRAVRAGAAAIAVAVVAVAGGCAAPEFTYVKNSGQKTYDASADPSPDHLLTDEVTNEPIVYVRVAQLTEAQQNAISLDMLRDSFLPVTDGAREAAAATLPLTGFELVHDEVLTPSNGLHGVRVIYDYELAGDVLHTFDQTALVNNDGSKVYLLIIRCTTTCYRERSSELDTIAKSFTVRSD
jgi:hypothetical protein